MKKVINYIKRIYDKINWSEVKKVEFETVTNLIITSFCYAFCLACIVAALLGAYWQLFWVVPMYVLGAVCLNDTTYGNESALHYLERVFSK